MFVVVVTISVKADRIPEFIEATKDNARNTRKEPGNVRFDVLQSEEDPTHFLLYEAYHTKDGFAAHQKTDHYARWNAKAADLLQTPRTRVKTNTIFFGDGQ